MEDQTEEVTNDYSEFVSVSLALLLLLLKAFWRWWRCYCLSGDFLHLKLFFVVAAAVRNRDAMNLMNCSLYRLFYFHFLNKVKFYI